MLFIVPPLIKQLGNSMLIVPFIDELTVKEIALPTSIVFELELN